MVRNRVLLVLCLAGLLASFALAFVTHAPNRLVSGAPISLIGAADGAKLFALFPGAVLVFGLFLPPRRAVHAMIAVAAAAFLVTIWWLAGAHAEGLAVRHWR